MKAKNWLEITTGAAVLLLALFFGSYALRLTGGGSASPSYPLIAEFVSAEGITAGGDVRMAGVKIGRVGDLTLDNENFTANVQLLINEGISVPTDSEVKVASDGLLGGAFVEVVPGADIVMLEPNDKFQYASGSVSLISLLAKFATGGATESK